VFEPVGVLYSPHLVSLFSCYSMKTHLFIPRVPCVAHAHQILGFCQSDDNAKDNKL